MAENTQTSNEVEVQQMENTNTEDIEKVLIAREARLAESEAKLAAKFVEITKKADELAAREGQLEERINQLKEGEKRNTSKEAELARREESLGKREKKIQEIEAGLLSREISVGERENDIEAREKNEELALKKQQVEAKALLEAELATERVNAINSLNEQLTIERTNFEAEITRSGNEQRTLLEQELEKRRKDATKEIARRIQESDQQISANIEERTSAISEREKKFEARVTEFETRVKAVDAQEENLEARESALAQEKKHVEREKRRLKNRQEELDAQEQDLTGLVRNACSAERDNLRAEMQAKEQALQELRNRISSLVAEQQAIESFKASIGNDPAIIENERLNLTKTIEQLKAELALRAPGEVQKERDDLRLECENLRLTLEEVEKKNRMLAQRNDELSSLDTANQVLTSRNEELDSLVRELRSKNESYKQRIERLCSIEERKADRDERVKEIQKGYLPKLIGANMPLEFSETAWLQNIYNQCDRYGIHFPKRILYAFHTALKISDWSTVTVLAGVSGTGKSELPKLYAAFGGMNFINVPVQPSWDSQESMLGFFNSIDNRFDPEPLLKFLVQCTDSEEYNKYMSIVLLDEMNLAHVEHYFADFLSKLESRRGTKEVPKIEVKLGAGVDPYMLELKRSILWTGTMNQDETTKSLSDKVLDRGLVINFPRPKTLIGRAGMKNLDKMVETSNRPMLQEAKWQSWIVKKIELSPEEEKEVNRYKSIVEEINNRLEQVGRALGHRVWQSIEHYMLNYPSVVEERQKSNGEMSTALKEAMRVAFEDQIVQKIMPKLRGVETRGRGKENLAKIEQILEENGFERLKDDFTIACEQGYGQFIWSSAKYIEVDEAERGVQSDDSAQDGASIPQQEETSGTVES